MIEIHECPRCGAEIEVKVWFENHGHGMLERTENPRPCPNCGKDTDETEDDEE